MAFKLLSLPLELRQNIFDYYLESQNIWIHTPTSSRHKQHEEIGDSDESPLAVRPQARLYFMNTPDLILVCRQIHGEIARRWMGHVTFYCPTNLAVLETLRTLSANNIKEANRLVLVNAESIVVEVAAEPEDAVPAVDQPKPAEGSSPEPEPEAVLMSPEVRTWSQHLSEGPYRAQIHLSQILEAFDIRFNEIHSWRASFDRAPEHHGFNFAALTATHWHTLYLYFNTDSPYPEDMANQAQRDMARNANSFAMCTTYEGDLQGDLMGDGLETWLIPRNKYARNRRLGYEGPKLESLVQARSDGIHMVGVEGWGTGIEMVKNWGLVEEQSRTISFPGAFEYVQLRSKRPKDFLARLQSMMAGENVSRQE